MGDKQQKRKRGSPKGNKKISQRESVENVSNDKTPITKKKSSKNTKSPNTPSDQPKLTTGKLSKEQVEELDWDIMPLKIHKKKEKSSEGEEADTVKEEASKDSKITQTPKDKKRKKAEENEKLAARKKAKKDDQHVKRNKKEERGVIYLGRIPYGFEEDGMRKFFNQFGRVKYLRLSRTKKKGKPKHYAFIEFVHPEVADIVVEAMDGYLMYNHIMRCSRIPTEQIHPKLFKGAHVPFVPKSQKRIREELNRPKTLLKLKNNIRKRLVKERKHNKRLQQLGIDYSFHGLEVCVEKAGINLDAKSGKFLEDDSEDEDYILDLARKTGEGHADISDVEPEEDTNKDNLNESDDENSEGEENGVGSENEEDNSGDEEEDDEEEADNDSELEFESESESESD